MLLLGSDKPAKHAYRTIAVVEGSRLFAQTFVNQRLDVLPVQASTMQMYECCSVSTIPAAYRPCLKQQHQRFARNRIGNL